MLAEAVAAVAVAMVVLWAVLQPLVRPAIFERRPSEPLDPEETSKGIALAALKEIEFDRETGKLSEVDYEFLKGKYTAAALEALREERAGVTDDVEALIDARVRSLHSAHPDSPPACLTCGPRPEPDAVFCSSCGAQLSSQACTRCGAALAAGSRFCEGCGRPVAA